MKIHNILVTGASGTIGKNLIPELKKAGYSIRAVQFNTPLSYPGVEVVKGSVSDRDFVKTALKDMEAVCHLATCKEDWEHFLDVSIRGTFNLLEESKKAGIRQFILAGGDAALGIFFYPNPYPLNENAPLRAYPGCYAFSKAIEETMCNQYYIQYKFPITILRFSWIQDKDLILHHMTLKEQGMWKEIAETKEQKEYFEKGIDGVGKLLHPDGRPFIRHVVGIKDVVQAFLLALGNEGTIGQTFNIAAPSAFGYDVLANYISKRLNLPVVEFHSDKYYDFSIDITKARSILGYKAKYDIFRIVDEAIEFRKSGGEKTPSKYSG